MKSRDGKSQRREEKRRRKKTQVHDKVGKSRNTVLFRWFVAPEGRKVGSLKRRVRSQLARWEMKNCTPLWREAHLQEKKLKTLRVRSTFGSWAVEKSARRCGAKHISKSKCTKHTMFGPLFEVEMSKKCTRGRRKGLWTLSKVSNTWGFCSISKNDGRRGTFEKRICKDAFSVAGAVQVVQETCSSELLGGPALISWEGLHFGASDLQFCWDDFAWQVQHFVWPGITYSWQAQYFRQVEWKNRKTHWYEAVSSALNFPFLKDVSQNCLVLMLSPSKNEDVSQNCSVFDVVKFKN